MYRSGRQEEAKLLTDSLRAHATREGNTMFWNNKSGYYWYQNQLETQALMVEVFHEVLQDKKAVDAIKMWLLLQKKENYWGSTKATSSAVYALLIGNNWMTDTKAPEIRIDEEELLITENMMEKGSGYLKKRISNKDIKKISIKNNNESVPVFGNIFHQYHTPIDHIKTERDTTVCNIKRTLYKVSYTNNGDSLTALNESSILNRGDRIRVKLNFYSPQRLEFVHLKDQRAAGFEPAKQLSKYYYKDKLSYYQNMRDASANFFMASVPAGKHEISYDILVNQKGRFQTGYTMLQSMYAPEYTVYDKSLILKVE
jgi:hypothetical protein